MSPPALRSIRSTEPRSTNRPSTMTGSARLRGSRPSSLRPKLNSKYSGSHDRVVCHLLHPDAEVAPQFVHFVTPDALDRRRELLGVVGRHPIEHAVAASATHGPRDRARSAAPRPPAWRDRTRPARMKQAAARQRIEPDQRLRLVARLEAIDRREQELVRTRREALERRQRVRAVGEPMLLERRLDCRATPDEAVARATTPSARASSG